MLVGAQWLDMSCYGDKEIKKEQSAWIKRSRKPLVPEYPDIWVIRCYRVQIVLIEELLNIILSLLLLLTCVLLTVWINALPCFGDMTAFDGGSASTIATRLSGFQPHGSRTTHMSHEPIVILSKLYVGLLAIRQPRLPLRVLIF